MQDGKYVILYVDDDQDMLDAVRITLEHLKGCATADHKLDGVARTRA